MVLKYEKKVYKCCLPDNGALRSRELCKKKTFIHFAQRSKIY